MPASDMSPNAGNPSLGLMPSPTQTQLQWAHPDMSSPQAPPRGHADASEPSERPVGVAPTPRPQQVP
jgi:hypothetical protein